MACAAIQSGLDNKKGSIKASTRQPMNINAHPKRMFRLKNTMLAIFAGILLTLLCVYASLTDRILISSQLGLALLSVSWCVSLTIVALIASGYTESFTDPGLTHMQLYWTLSNTLLAMVLIEGLQHIIIMFLLCSVVIGAFRLRRRQYLVYSLYATVMYALLALFTALQSVPVPLSDAWLSQPVLDEGMNALIFAFICFLISEVGAAVTWYRESLKRKNAELEKALAAKSQFLANMSHELRTPLNGIVGMTSLMMDTTLSTDQDECAQNIMTSSNALAEIIDNVLDFSKIEANELKLEEQVFSLAALIENTVQITLPRAREKRLCYEVNIDPNIPHELIGDALRIKQVLVNLLSNAIKFTPSGYILISVERLSASSQDGSVTLRFSVEDSGIGIAKDKLNSIFDMFSQEDGSTSRLFGGTGLGLSISSSLLALMGSKIQVDSEKGQKTAFTFELNLALAEHSIDNSTAALPLLANSLIFTFEDHPRSRRLRCQQAICYGAKAIDVASFTDLQDQLKMLKADHKGLVFIVVDDSQSKCLSAEKIALLRAQCLIDFSVVCLCLYATNQKIQQLKKMGCDYAFAKPFFNQSLNSAASTMPSSLLKAMGVKEGHNHTAHYHPFNANILVVEDNRVNQLVICKLLKKMACTVELAENGIEALKRCEESRYDLILMDCQMPEMDGYQTAQALRLSRGLNTKTPIVALTANALEGDKQKCMDAGMCDYMSKPVKIEQLEMVLSSYIG